MSCILPPLAFLDSPPPPPYHGRTADANASLAPLATPCLLPPPPPPGDSHPPAARRHPWSQLATPHASSFLSSRAPAEEDLAPSPSPLSPCAPSPPLPPRPLAISPFESPPLTAWLGAPCFKPESDKTYSRPAFRHG
ncbi:hypothetical protein NL676_008087 [Syzygium grande]|nr:hypothetical protein NL676_008087 [Syzygium grande]